MKTNRLLLNCAKFCKSEGIYNFSNNADLIICLNGKFITFRFGTTKNEKQDKKLIDNGGRIYRPSSLREFVDTVRLIQITSRGG